jgi:hypothetical protein
MAIEDLKLIASRRNNRLTTALALAGIIKLYKLFNSILVL